MLRAQQAVFQARSVAELERAKRLPDPSVSLGMKRAQEVGRNQLVVGISVPLPILDSNRGNQLQALRLADKAEDELLATRQQMHALLQQQRLALALGLATLHVAGSLCMTWAGLQSAALLRLESRF